MEYCSQFARSVVAIPVDDCVVSVHVASQSHILPLIKNGTVPPPLISCCRDRHVIRMKEAVVIVDVQAEVTVFPRTISRDQVEESARMSLLDALEADNVAPTPEAYAEGLRAMTQRLTNRMRQCGVEIT